MRQLSPAIVWRWHFYAALLCMPFVLWLACTGSLYLFKPQLDAWLDRPVDARVARDGPAQAPSLQVQAALQAVPDAIFTAYELPEASHRAARVLVSQHGALTRVYLDPATLAVLRVVREDDRLTRVLFHLHGELLWGDRGSLLVELAASWTLVMILTGMYLWWPRDGRGLGGVLWPRWSLQDRPWWKDLHAVTGFWVAAFTVFLLVSGLPWAKSWGGLLKQLRQAGSAAEVRQDWPTGSEAGRRSPAGSAHADHGAHGDHQRPGGRMMMPADWAALDRLVPVVAGERLAAPVLLAPPSNRTPTWNARSDTQVRPLRTQLLLDGAAGTITARQPFATRPWLDRVIGYGVAAHEGQLFGWPNQLLGLLTASGLVTVTISGTVMWLRRRPAGQIGAPRGVLDARLPVALMAIIVLLGLLLPLLGLSLLLVLALDRWLVPRLPVLARWLGHPQARS